MTTAVVTLSFYDHHRQTYGHMKIADGEAEFMVGDYGAPGEDEGCGLGGEFAIVLHRFSHDAHLTPQLRVFSDATGSLKAFLARGAWDEVCDNALRTRDDLTRVLTDAGLHDRSHHPIGHKPSCHCCGRPTDG